MRKTTLRRTALFLIAALCLAVSAFASGEPAGASSSVMLTCGFAA